MLDLYLLHLRPVVAGFGMDLDRDFELIDILHDIFDILGLLFSFIFLGLKHQFIVN